MNLIYLFSISLLTELTSILFETPPAINFGLAHRENISWGKPEGAEFRKYFINRQFDFNSLITSFLNDSVTIHCSNESCL